MRRLSQLCVVVLIAALALGAVGIAWKALNSTEERPIKPIRVTLSTGYSTLMTLETGQLLYLPVPTREGYKFLGWFTEKEGGVQVTTENVFESNDTIYAHWEKEP